MSVPKLILSIAILFSLVAAETYYVSPDGTDGNDGTSGGSGAWKTIATSAGKIAAGDTLVIQDGTYEEPQIKFEISGTEDSPIVVMAENKWGAKIVAVTPWHALDVSASHYIVDGLDISFKSNNPDSGFFGMFISFDATYVWVRDCYVHDCPRSGIQVMEADRVLIENCRSARNAYYGTGSGISVVNGKNIVPGDGYHYIIRGNTVYDNRNLKGAWLENPTDGNGIIIDRIRDAQFSSSENWALVENNVSIHNGAHGIHVYKSENATVRNNICYYGEFIQTQVQGMGWIAPLSAVDASNCLYINNISIADPGRMEAGGMGAGNDMSNPGTANVWKNNILVASSGDAMRNPTGNAPQVSGTISTMPDFEKLPAFDNRNDPNTEVVNNIDEVSFKLKSGSSGIDAGSLDNYAAFDFYGNERDGNGKVDVGPHEYGGSSSSQVLLGWDEKPVGLIRNNQPRSYKMATDAAVSNGMIRMFDMKGRMIFKGSEAMVKSGAVMLPRGAYVTKRNTDLVSQFLAE